MAALSYKLGHVRSKPAAAVVAAAGKATALAISAAPSCSRAHLRVHLAAHARECRQGGKHAERHPR